MSRRLLLHNADRLGSRLIDGGRDELSGGHPPFTARFRVTDSTRAERLDDLVRLADLGLYAAKEAGRDRITISESLPETPDLTVVADTRAGKDEAPRKRRSRPALLEAAHEDDPLNGGLEIR